MKHLLVSRRKELSFQVSDDTKHRIQRERSSLCIVVLSPLALLHVALLLRSFFAAEKARYRGRERKLKLGQRNGGRTDRAQTRRARGDCERRRGEKGKGREGSRRERGQKRKFGEDREKGDTIRVGKLDRPNIALSNGS